MGVPGDAGPPPPVGGVVGDGGVDGREGDDGGPGLAGVGIGLMLHSFWQLACEHGVRLDA